MVTPTESTLAVPPLRIEIEPCCAETDCGWRTVVLARGDKRVVLDRQRPDEAEELAADLRAVLDPSAGGLAGEGA